MTNVAQYIKRVATQTPMDFSSAQATTGWLVQSLSNPSKSWMRVVPYVHKLHERIALTNGHGLGRLWTVFSRMNIAVLDDFVKYEAVSLSSGTLLAILTCDDDSRRDHRCTDTNIADISDCDSSSYYFGSSA